MRAGLLDRRIVIEKKTETIDSYGQRTVTWATFLTVWAMFVQRKGKEKDEDNNRVTERIVEFKIRYDATITNKMRILYNSDYYKIDDIKELGRQDGMIIFCEKLSQS